MPDTAFEFDLLVIGSGPAGQRAALQSAKLGKRVCVVDKSRMVGGACTETGTIPSKTFREAVRSLTRRSLMLSLHSIGARPVPGINRRSGSASWGRSPACRAGHRRTERRP
jgi:NADPH-dependent 2,4-dienoyl-CoA reductase/sulfur reductase-like enzyme